MKTVRHWLKGVTFDAALACLFYPTRIDVADGKYTIIYDFATGQSECLHHGAPWRSLVGDKMVLACFDEIVELRRAKLSLIEGSLCDLRRIDGLIAEVETLRAALRPFAALADHYPTEKKYGNRPSSGVLFEVSSGNKTASYTVEDVHAAASALRNVKGDVK